VRPGRRDDGICVDVEGELSDRGSSSIVSFQYKRPSAMIDLEKLSVSNEGRVMGEVSMKTSAFSKLYLSAQDERSEPGKSLNSSAKVGAVYAGNTCEMDANIDVVNGPTGRFSMVFSPYKNFLMGTYIQVNAHWDDPRKNEDGSSKSMIEMEDMSLGMIYDNPSSGVHVFGKSYNKAQVLCFGHIHHWTEKTQFGIMVDYSLRSNNQVLTMASCTQVDDATEARIRINSKADVNATIKHKFSTNFVMSATLALNIQDNISAAQKVGIGLTLE
jgi:hypothetical protein